MNTNRDIDTKLWSHLYKRQKDTQAIDQWITQPITRSLVSARTASSRGRPNQQIL